MFYMGGYFIMVVSFASVFRYMCVRILDVRFYIIVYYLWSCSVGLFHYDYYSRKINSYYVCLYSILAIFL